jgi:hypothetical protein
MGYYVPFRRTSSYYSKSPLLKMLAVTHRAVSISHPRIQSIKYTDRDKSGEIVPGAWPDVSLGIEVVDSFYHHNQLMF